MSELTTAEAIVGAFTFQETAGEPFNIVSVLDDFVRKVMYLTDAITPSDSSGAEDATGTHVCSLTESVMGVTAGLCKIATAIESLADAVRDKTWKRLSFSILISQPDFVLTASVESGFFFFTTQVQQQTRTPSSRKM